MGIWMELGIFIVVLGWGFWQLYDVKQAKLRRIADEAQRASEAAKATASNPEKSETKDAALPLPPA